MSTALTPEIDDDQCRNCGTVVSRKFRAIFAGNGDVPHACRECATTKELMEGAAATPADPTEAI